MTDTAAIHATVSRPAGVYTVSVTDGTNTTSHTPTVTSGHEAAMTALTEHRTQWPPVGQPEIVITIAAGAA